MIGQSIRVGTVVVTAIECVAITQWVIGLVELIVHVHIHKATVAIIGVVQIVDTIVVVIPIDVVLKAVTIDV